MALEEEEELGGGVSPPERPRVAAAEVVLLALAGGLAAAGAVVAAGLLPLDADGPGAGGGSTGLSAGEGVGVVARGGRALAAAARLTPLLALLRREEGWREEGVAMDRAGRTGERRVRERRSTVWIPEINDPSNRQVGLGVGNAGGKAGGGAAGGEHPVTG